NLHNEISNFQQRIDESFHEAWDRYKDLQRACPHHGFIELHQLDTFYNALNPPDQDSLNAAAGGNLLERSTQDALTIIENKSKNMMASLLQINTASTSRSGSLPSNTVANPKGELKAIITRSGLVIDGPTVSTPSRSINPEKDERVEETFTGPDLAEYTIKKMLKALLSNKDKLQELANTPLNENCSAVILKKLPEKLGDPGKFLIPCGFSELKCKALADLVESDAENIYNDPFDSKGKKIKESKLLIDELDLPCDIHPPPEYDSFISQDFSKVDALASTNNEDKIFNPLFPEILRLLPKDFVIKSSFPQLHIRNHAKHSRRTKNDSVKLEVKAKQGLFGNPESSHV
nr:reverse transcriptase domain-containing protein [Tanacetum cinerariifolium]